MKLRNRLLLVASGVVIFLIITPVLVLFARGFKFDLKNGQLIKTGSIVAQTDPKDAEVLLNDKKQKDKTPSTLRFLIPGDYVIKVEKENYLPWEKRLAVKSQFVTWVNHNRELLVLFLKEPKIQKALSIQNYYLPKDRKQLVFIQDGHLSYLDLNNKQIEVLGNDDLTIHPFDFSAELNWVDAHRSFDLIASKKTFDFDERLISRIKKAETNGSHIVLLIDNKLYKFSDRLEQLETNITDFGLSSDDLWYLKAGSLFRLNLENNAKTQVMTDVPAASESKIIRGNGHIFLLLDKSLYMLNDKLEKIYDNITYTYWDPEFGRLLYANDYEVFLYSPLENQSELILRSTTKVSQPLSNSATGYVFIESEGKIKAVEIDGRDHRNVYVLTDAQEQFLVSRDGKMLYTFNQIEIKPYEIR